MSFGYSPDCRRVGPEVEFGNTNVSYEDVTQLRNAAFSFYEASTTQGIGLSEQSMAFAGALFFRGMTEVDIDMPNVSMALKLTHEEIPSGWRLTAGVGSFNDFRGPNKRQTWYRIETLDHQVMVAVKAVKFIMDELHIVIEDDQPEAFTSQHRKMYEKPMDRDDCQKLTDRLLSARDRAAKRVPDPLAINPMSRLRDC